MFVEQEYGEQQHFWLTGRRSTAVLEQIRWLMRRRGRTSDAPAAQAAAAEAGGRKARPGKAGGVDEKTA